MSVAEVVLHSAGASGSASKEQDKDLQASYRSRYRVRVTSPLDGPTTIFRYFQINANLPWFGRSFFFGNDFDTSVRCKTIEPTFIEKSEGWWEVACSFETPPKKDDEEDKDDEDEKDKDSPTSSQHDEIEVSYTQTSAPVEQATYLKSDRVTSRWLTKHEGRPCPVMNSAGVVFNPGIEEEIEIKVIRITKHVKEYDSNDYDKFQGAVNADAVTINKKPYKFKCEFSPLVAKIKNITGSLVTENGKYHYKRTVEIHINPLGWRRTIVDRGMMRSAAPGDPDGRGGQMYASAGDEYVPGTALHAPILDANGYPVTEPVLLDGRGQPLKQDGQPVYLTYQTLEEKPFAAAAFLWN